MLMGQGEPKEEVPAITFVITDADVDRIATRLAAGTSSEAPNRLHMAMAWLGPFLIGLLTAGLNFAVFVHGSDKTMPCDRYVATVLSLGTQASDPIALRSTVERLKLGKETIRCGATPEELLKAAGRL
ncbi:MAG: hypothetical protein M3256_21295 [Actinomycetota bacterium]|nr:hypothetical protein [Actinomycetota bacterium]